MPIEAESGAFGGIWYIIYLLTAIGLTPGDRGTLHIYIQTVHRTTQLNIIRRTEHA
jgi:hypothetical protein